MQRISPQPTKASPEILSTINCASSLSPIADGRRMCAQGGSRRNDTVGGSGIPFPAGPRTPLSDEGNKIQSSDYLCIRPCSK